MAKRRIWGQIVSEMLLRIRHQRPLIHHITNFVVMNDTANVTLALGAQPVMAHAREEVAEMVQMAGALVLNPGTLSPEWVSSMLVAGRRANRLRIPVVLDPVGAGATRLRTYSALHLMNALRLAVIRGNSAELGALAGAGGIVRGVDSVEAVKQPLNVVTRLAAEYRSVVAMTGKRDLIGDGKRAMGVDNGHPLLQAVTGTGCMATTAVAAFCAVEKDYLLAATAALACYGLAAERAAVHAKAPGSFRVALIDALYELAPAQIEAGVKTVELKSNLRRKR